MNREKRYTGSGRILYELYKRAASTKQNFHVVEGPK
jgi:hypothetical protein